MPQICTDLLWGKTKANPKAIRLAGFDWFVAEPLASGFSLPDVFGVHLFWIDSNEFTGASREDFAALVSDLSDVVMDASANQAVTALGDKRLS